jgi:hypothetical protein
MARKGQRHLGYALVPIVDDDGKTPILPDLWKSWGLLREIDDDHCNITIWTSKVAAAKARRKIFGAQYKTMRVCRVRLEESDLTRRDEMGMFTTIVAPNGKLCQIKTGWDNCDTYKVGDKISWEPDPRYPGEHIDGIHLGFGKSDNDTCAVIKDCVVTAVLPRRWDRPTDIQIAMLKKRYGIKPPDRALWPEEAWTEKEARDKEAKERQEEWDRKHAHLSSSERMSAAMAEMILQKMNEPSLARKILPPKEQVSPIALFIVPRMGEHGGVQTVAIVKATVGKLDLVNEGSFLTALKRAVTAWLGHTKEGKEAWKDSSEDFNVGDLAHWTGSERLKKALEKEGITDLDISCTDVLNGGSWTFDHVLKEE